MKYKQLKELPERPVGTIWCKGVNEYVSGSDSYPIYIMENNSEWFARFVFKTEDLIDIYVGDTYYTVFDKPYDNIEVNVVYGKYIADDINYSNRAKKFSTEQAALIYISKKKYPVGTMVKCLLVNKIKTIVSHNSPDVLENYTDDYGDIWLDGGNVNVLVYKKGKWAEIISEFKVGDFIKTNSGNIHQIIDIGGDNVEFVKVQGNKTSLYIYKHMCTLATNEEVIKYYTDLGWVKGAKFKRKINHNEILAYIHIDELNRVLCCNCLLYTSPSPRDRG